MDDIKRQLTDPTFISGELSRLLNTDQDFALSIMEKHSHGESFDVEEGTAKAIIDRVSAIQNTDTRKQLINTAFALESLFHVIPALIAENNKRLLNLISHTSP